MQRVGVLLRAEKKTLGRHAAFIQARSAELLLLDQRRCKTGLRRAFRRQIAARAAADDDKVITHANPSGNGQISSTIL